MKSFFLEINTCLWRRLVHSREDPLLMDYLKIYALLAIEFLSSVTQMQLSVLVLLLDLGFSSYVSRSCGFGSQSRSRPQAQDLSCPF